MNPYCVIQVPGKAVPWQAPFVAPPKVRQRATRRGPAGSTYRTAYSDPALKAWEETVNLHARAAMAGTPVWTGPVGLFLCFERVADPDHRPGTLWVETPDLDNLAKAAIDGLKGVCFADDRLVVVQNAIKYYGAKDALRADCFRVSAEAWIGTPSENSVDFGPQDLARAWAWRLNSIALLSIRGDPADATPELRLR